MRLWRVKRKKDEYEKKWRSKRKAEEEKEEKEETGPGNL